MVVRLPSRCVQDMYLLFPKTLSLLCTKSLTHHHDFNELSPEIKYYLFWFIVLAYLLSPLQTHCGMPWMSTRSTSPPPKRIRLESDPLHAGRRADIEPAEDEGPSEDVVSELQCSICLQEIVDRTVIPTCSHEFCLECIRLWSGK